MRLDCPETSDTGAFRISWTDDGVHTLIEQAPGGGSRPIYEGPDTATTVSGREPGIYQYTVHGASPGASAHCEVEVAPPSLTLALALFCAGLGITAATVALIIWGHRRHERGEIG